MKHIVFVCQVFYPDNTATSQLFGDLLTNLADKSTRITVLCGYPTRRGQGQRAIAYETMGDVQILRCGWDIDAKRSYWARALAYVSFLAAVAVKLLQTPNKDIVFGVTNPPFLVIMLWLLSYMGRFRYQYMLLDVYPEGLLALDSLGQQSFVVRLWRACNQPSYLHADKLLVLGRDMRALLAKTYGISLGKFLYVPHWSSTAIQEPLAFAQNPLAEELRLQDKFVVQYSGNMGLWHDIDTIVQAAAKLASQPHIHFLFIGGGMRRKQAEELAARLELHNITWLDFFPKERLAESLTCCHAALVSLRSGLEGIAVPSKLYGILASGRAVIAQVPAASEIALVVDEERCGLVVEPGDVDALAEAIQTLAGDRAVTEAMGARAFAAYQQKYTLQQAVVHFRRLWSEDSTPEPAAIQRASLAR